MNMKYTQRGLTVMLVLAFMGVMLVVLGTITSYTLQQTKYGRALQAREQAVNIAEAGLEYYRWFLARNPSILTNGGAGLVSPYTYAVNDPQGGTLGNATVTATPALQCGQVQWIDLSSQGTANADTRFTRTVSARYMKPSVTQYAFLLNSNVWFGSSNVGVGPYFSNGGIRQDGTSNSTVSSALVSFTCDSSMGCSPSETKPGVFGAGTNQQLWMYPAPTIDFAVMAANFASLQSYAQSSGIYLSGTATYVGGAQQGSSYSSVAGSDATGYHLVFNTNGTVTVYRVTGTNNQTQGYRSNGDCSGSGGWCTEYDVITAQTLLGTYAVPATCGLVYVNAKAWVEGTVSGKVTVVVADTASYAPDVLIPGNISYATTDGTTGLTLIAEHSVRLPINSPDSLSIRGIFIAQSGYYGRDYYYAGYTGGYDSYIVRSALTVAGSVVASQRGAMCWSSGGACSSGYSMRSNTYDRILAFIPPPFTPSATTTYGTVLWQEN